METLTRLVAESLARHGFDRPVDIRRLQWSRWFRCESHHSLLTVPSQPGVFALAEEIMDMGSSPEHVGTAASAVQRSGASTPDPTLEVEERRFSAASDVSKNRASAPVVAEPRRMLAVSQFLEDDDMAFVLDRMLAQENPMRARLASGRYFVRYVVIEDATQRRSICNALNQWIVSSAEKATGIGTNFASSLEIMPGAERTHVATAPSAHVETAAFGCPATLRETKGSTSLQNAENQYAEERHISAASGVPANRALAPVTLESRKPKTGDISNPTQTDERRVNTAPRLNSAIATNIHCSSSFPSGF